MIQTRWWARASLLLGLLLGLQAAPAALRDTLARGDEALAAGRPVLALELYRKVAEHAEGKPAVALQVAQAQLALAQEETTNPTAAFQAAREAWLAAIPYHGLSIPVRRGLAETYLGLGETLAAAEQWQTVFAARPSDLSLWYQLAPAHLDKGEWQAAGRAYAAIARLQPDNAQAHYWAGALNLPTNPARAREHLLQARNDLFYQKRADALLLALEELNSITRPAHVAGRLGVAYLAVARPALAQVQLQAALTQEPGYADAWAYLGLAQNQRGRDGRAAIARAIELAPDSSLAHSLMGRHWLWHGRPHLARPEFLAAAQLDPDNPAHLADVAFTYQIEKEYRLAEAWYQAAVRRAPEQPTFWILLAQFHLDTLNNVHDGLLLAQKGVALAPEEPDALDTLGWAQLLSGQLRLAETNLLAAQQRDPSNPAVHYHLGRLHIEQGKWAEAAVALKQAIALDSGGRERPAPQPGPYAQLARHALEQMGN